MNRRDVSADAQATLLLTAYLGGLSGSLQPATLSEYNLIARALHNVELRPASLVDSAPNATALQCVSEVIGDERAKHLLSRSLLLATEISMWQSLGVWVLARGDHDYPEHFRARMGSKAPPLLFGVGPQELLEGLGLGVVGSRDVDEDGASFAAEAGVLAARAGITLVSGAAHGADRSAMSGALGAGGNSVGILSDSLKKAAINSDSRRFIEEGQLTLISQSEPGQRFMAWRAMERNKLIYALAFATLVVESNNGKGGTWEGAREQLQKLHYCDVYVRMTTPQSPGRKALESLGAKPWSVTSSEALGELREASVETSPPAPERVPAQQLNLLDF